MSITRDELLGFLHTGHWRGVKLLDDAEHIRATLGAPCDIGMVKRPYELLAYESRNVQLTLYGSRLILIAIYFRGETCMLSINEAHAANESGAHVVLDDGQIDSFQLSRSAP